MTRRDDVDLGVKITGAKETKAGLEEVRDGMEGVGKSSETTFQKMTGALDKVRSAFKMITGLFVANEIVNWGREVVKILDEIHEKQQRNATAMMDLNASLQDFFKGQGVLTAEGQRKETEKLLGLSAASGIPLAGISELVDKYKQYNAGAEIPQQLLKQIAVAPAPLEAMPTLFAKMKQMTPDQQSEYFNRVIAAIGAAGISGQDYISLLGQMGKLGMQPQQELETVIKLTQDPQIQLLTQKQHRFAAMAELINNATLEKGKRDPELYKRYMDLVSGQAAPTLAEPMDVTTAFEAYRQTPAFIKNLAVVTILRKQLESGGSVDDAARAALYDIAKGVKDTSKKPSMYYWRYGLTDEEQLKGIAEELYTGPEPYMPVPYGPGAPVQISIEQAKAMREHATKEKKWRGMTPYEQLQTVTTINYHPVYYQDKTPPELQGVGVQGQ